MMTHLGDITKINGAEIPAVDVITGGSPCQDLSVAGKRAGLAGERSGLFMEQIRIVKEMREKDVRSGRNPAHARPRYMVWENVPGAFSSGTPKGADFAAVIEEIIKAAEPGADVRVRVPDGGWTKSGCYYAEDGTWSIAWRLHDAQFWRVPQRRKRIALVADFGGLSAPEVLFERKGLSRYPEPCGEAGKTAPEATGGGAENAEPILLESNQNHATVQTDGISTAFRVPSFNCAAMLSDNPNAGFHESETANTLDGQGGNPGCYQGGNQKPHICLFSPGVSVFENHSQDSRYKALGEISETVSAKYGTGGNNQPLVVNSAVCVGNGQMANISMKEVANTLDTMHDQQAVIVFDKEMYNCGERCTGSPQAKEDSVAPTCRADGHPSGVAFNSVVRRLTPLECERLQGFPDGWTDIGDWVDSKGKKHRASDSPRYKALGNSIALPFWFWLLRRISAQYERPATLGSLFDGIGGFPLCWERCNGKGTALWASEIEEFPIAVTKIRFSETKGETT